jgi:hypothetical protein
MSASTLDQGSGPGNPQAQTNLELVVLDREKNVPVRIIDSQDLARMKLV